MYSFYIFLIRGDTMLDAIEFKSDRFKKEDNYNLIEFTENTVILCSDYKLMDTLMKERIISIEKVLKTYKLNMRQNDTFRYQMI